VQLNAYLNFNGDCEAAFKFYERCLGGKIVAMRRHGDSPIADHVPAGWRDRIMHARLDVGNMVLMGADAQPERYQKPQGLYVSLGFAKPDDAERIFKALGERGTVQMPLQKTFWSERFGMLVDGFGIPWMVNCDPTL
jgi:PhnB protein